MSGLLVLIAASSILAFSISDKASFAIFNNSGSVTFAKLTFFNKHFALLILSSSARALHLISAMRKSSSVLAQCSANAFAISSRLLRCSPVLSSRVLLASSISALVATSCAVTVTSGVLKICSRSALAALSSAMRRLASASISSQAASDSA